MQNHNSGGLSAQPDECDSTVDLQLLEDRYSGHSQVLNDPGFTAVARTEYGIDIPTETLFGSQNVQPQMPPFIQEQFYTQNGLASSSSGIAPDGTFSFDPQASASEQPQVDPAPFAGYSGDTAQQTDTIKILKPSKKGEHRPECQCACGCSSRFYETKKLDNSRCPSCRKGSKQGCVSALSPSQNAAQPTQLSTLTPSHSTSTDTASQRLLKNNMSPAGQVSKAPQQQVGTGLVTLPRLTSLQLQDSTTQRHHRVERAQAGQQVKDSVRGSSTGMPAANNRIGAAGPAETTRSKAKVGSDNIHPGAESADKATPEPVTEQGPAPQVHDPGQPPTDNTALNINGAGELQHFLPFQDEAATDRYLSGDRNEVGYIALDVNNDDLHQVSAQQKNAILIKLFRSLVAAPADPPAELAAQEQTKFCQRQKEALEHCKERMADDEGSKRAAACVAKLYFICTRTHKHGIPIYALKSSQKAKPTSTKTRYNVDWTSAFTARMEKLTSIMGNKRVVIDLLAADAKLEDMAFAPEAYLMRKLKNFAPNEEKNEALRRQNALEPKPEERKAPKQKETGEKGQLQFTALPSPFDYADPDAQTAGADSSDSSSDFDGDADDDGEAGQGGRKRKRPRQEVAKQRQTRYATNN